MFSEREKSGKEDSRPRTEGKAELILGAVLRQALSLVSSRKCRAAEELEWMSRAVRETARSLGREDPTGISRYAEQAANQIGRASDYFREREIEDLLRDLERAVRKRPAAAAGAALAAGFVAARFLKASGGVRR